MNSFHLEIDGSDVDPQETLEWLEALDDLTVCDGPQRVRYLMSKLLYRARQTGVQINAHAFAPYWNTIPVERQPSYPGDLEIEARLRALVRWNALAMVARASRSRLDAFSPFPSAT